MERTRKRKANYTTGDNPTKRPKSLKQWRVPKSQKNVNSYATNIEPGDSGIWATCEMHKEGKCTGELRNLFNDYAEKLYPTLLSDQETVEESGKSVEVDIEAEIDREIQGIQQSTVKSLIQPVKIDIKCVLFFKTLTPVEPVSFVHQICADAAKSAGSKKNRWIKRLSPMTLIGKATEKGLEGVTKAVLAPHFHQEGNPLRKFAIRTSIRNHTTLGKDVVIKQVADAVGKPHTVDLHGYDLLILVEVYKNICGMSVVGSDYDKLRRYNLAEIYDPTPRPETNRL